MLGLLLPLLSTVALVVTEDRVVALDIDELVVATAIVLSVAGVVVDLTGVSMCVDTLRTVSLVELLIGITVLLPELDWVILVDPLMEVLAVLLRGVPLGELSSAIAKGRVGIRRIYLLRNFMATANS